MKKVLIGLLIVSVFTTAHADTELLISPGLIQVGSARPGSTSFAYINSKTNIAPGIYSIWILRNLASDEKNNWNFKSTLSQQIHYCASQSYATITTVAYSKINNQGTAVAIDTELAGPDRIVKGNASTSETIHALLCK